ncbi:MAG TPA: DUF6017 domain-containing protein [Lachnospiraceae bacterium]|nr:DUF6017 domain-containing protein [Lachnospiraceae bacterium]
MSEKITYSYYTGAQASQTAFYRLPRALYEKEYFRGLSNDAKTLYALMLDRMSLSLANDWLDAEGRVYINYSLESIMETLGCGKTKAVALLKELDSETGIGLIEKKNMGIAKATVFYVKNFMLEDEEREEVDNSVSRVQKTNSQEDIEFKNRTRTCSENEPDRVQNLNLNKTNINKTDFNKTNPILSINHTDEMDEMEIYSQIIKENIEYDCLLERHPYDKEMVEGIYDLILEMVLSKSKEITIAGSVYPNNLVKSKFLKINFSQVEYVIDCLGKNTTKVHNIKSYLLTSLFNAGSTISGYYKAEVNYDMPQYAG